jgi:hypothetical protein
LPSAEQVPPPPADQLPPIAPDAPPVLPPGAHADALAGLPASGPELLDVPSSVPDAAAFVGVTAQADIPSSVPDPAAFVGVAGEADVAGQAARSNASGLTVFSDPTIPVASSTAADMGGDPLQELAAAVTEAAQDALAAVARLWADPPSPGIGTRGADGALEPSAAVGLLQSSLSWYTAAIAVLAVLLAAGRMAWQRRAQPAADLLRGLGTLVLVTAAAVTAVGLLVGAADAFSVWVLDQATDDVEGSFVALLALPESGSMPVVLTILLGSAVMLGAVLQIVLVIARGAVLVVLTGLLPLSASATATDTGRAVFVRTLTWVVAFILYQPVAAMIYATSFLVAPNPDASPVIAALTGLTFLGLALAALPALLRVLRPVLSAVTSEHRGAHAASRLPSGALAVGPATLAVSAQVLRGGGSTYAVGAPARTAGGSSLHAAPRTNRSRVALGGTGLLQHGVPGSLPHGVPGRRVLEIQGEASPATLIDAPADDARPVPHPRPGGEDVS